MKMALITKIIKFSKQLPIKPTHPYFINSVRTAVHMRDWMPGDHPKTKEQKLKAAKKYNLHPDEYVPFEEVDEMGMGHGDYPNIPAIGYAGKDPYYPWDIPADRRNYMEMLPEDFDHIGPDKLDQTGVKQRISIKEAYITFFSVMSVIFGLYWLGEDYKVFRPVLEKQYPQEGVKHYTFEPVK